MTTQELIQLAVEKTVIIQRGNWFLYNEESVGNGLTQAITRLDTDSELRAKILADLKVGQAESGTDAPAKTKTSWLFYCKRINANYQMWRGVDQKGNPRPVKEYQFRNHEMTLTDPTEVAELKAHDLYGLHFWEVDDSPASVKESGTRYHEGVATTASFTDRKAEGSD